MRGFRAENFYNFVKTKYVELKTTNITIPYNLNISKTQNLFIRKLNNSAIIKGEIPNHAKTKPDNVPCPFLNSLKIDNINTKTKAVSICPPLGKNYHKIYQ